PGLVHRGGRASSAPGSGRGRPGGGVRRGRGWGAATVAAQAVRPRVVVDAHRRPDIHVKVGKTLYSIPWRFIGQKVDARETATVVQFFYNGELIATHGRKPKGKQTDNGHYPPEKIAFHLKTPTWCRHRAAEIGPGCQGVVDTLL